MFLVIKKGGTNMKEAENDDPQMDFKELSAQDAENLKNIILKNGSLWAIAVESYNLGRKTNAPKS